MSNVPSISSGAAAADGAVPARDPAARGAAAPARRGVAPGAAARAHRLPAVPRALALTSRRQPAAAAAARLRHWIDSHFHAWMYLTEADSEGAATSHRAERRTTIQTARRQTFFLDRTGHRQRNTTPNDPTSTEPIASPRPTDDAIHNVSTPLRVAVTITSIYEYEGYK